MDVQGIYDAVVGHHRATGRYEHVVGHEPKSAPDDALTGAIWVRRIRPIALASGLDASSAILTLMSRTYHNMLVDPMDEIDPAIALTVVDVMTRLHGDLTLGGLARNIDVLGQFGEAFAAQDGYIGQDGRIYRVMDLTIPVVVNDVFPQVA